MTKAIEKTIKILCLGRAFSVDPSEEATVNYGALFRSALVVSRNMIIEHVWDQSFGTVGNLVEVYVYQLRNKIDGGRAAKLVQVV